MRACAACSMPLGNPDDFGTHSGGYDFCIHCIKPDKSVKSCTDIFAGGVGFFMATIPGMSPDLAERVVRKNMNALPYWKGCAEKCLAGAQATDAEFAQVLEKLRG